MSTDGEIYRKAKDLFEEMSELSPHERGVLLDSLSSSDPELRREIEDLLREAELADAQFDELERDILEPTMRSLCKDPSLLDTWLQHQPGGDPGEEDLMLGRTVSHFKVLEIIGHGGMGMVYLAEDLKLDRKVVLKFLPACMSADTGAKKRFIQEARMASALEHPNIGTIYEIDETDDQHLFIAMAYYPGRTLKEVIAEGPVAPDLVLDYGIQLASALTKAHQCGIIHRDIKPGNILVGEDGRLRLLDFGLAELVGTAGLTLKSPLSGTVYYMSPEQVQGRIVDPRSDLWSLGVVLYEMLFGCRPFEGKDPRAVFQAILETDPDLEFSQPRQPHGKVSRLIRILRKCLAREPDVRYQSALELLDGLQAASNLPRSGRRGLVIGGVVSAALAAIVFEVVRSENASQVEPPVGGVTFTRVSGGALAEERGGFGGAQWGDYDGDGFMDFFTAGLTPMLFHNEGDGTFSRVDEGSIGLDFDSTITNPHKGLWVDFENDGDLDLYITYFYTNRDDAHRFFLNKGDGTFERARFDWIPSRSAVTVSWGDIDNDGLLDLFVGTFQKENLTVYHHQADGSMVPVAVPLRLSFGSVWSDIDMDGDVDLIASADPFFIHRNDGGFIFTALDPDILPGPRWEGTGSFCVNTGDFDNDGDLDLAVSNFSYNRLYRNDLEAGLVDLSNNVITLGKGVGSCLWGDYDNDGFLDLLFTNDRMLYHNEGDGTFRRVENDPMVMDEGGGAGGAFADFDNDGDLDIVLGDGILWGMKMADPPPTLAAYRNDGGTNNWITLTLEGTRSNRSAIGAKVFLTATIRGQVVRQLREVTSGGGQASLNDPRVHFGLGDAKRVQHIRIEWPSGQVTELEGLEHNQFLKIIEGES